MTTFQLAHISDTHIGYEAYKARSAAGENQRSVDIARAFVRSVDDIVAADPPLVIHSGDVADRTIIPIRLMLLIRQQITKLAALRPDGTRRQVVIVAGNHELPRNRKEACFLHLLDGLPGVHVVTSGYTQVTFDGTGISAGRDPVLDGTVVHALPHDALKTVDYDQVVPVDGRINIFSTHGVAGGSQLYVRSLGREFAVPTDVLARGWEYGALGHWHRQGPVPLVVAGGRRGVDAASADRGRIWYAGSTENMGFGDLKDDGVKRGWLQVTINPGGEPDVTRRYVPIRPMLRLPPVDAAELTPDEIADALISQVRDADTNGAVVGQPVFNVTRESWSLVPLYRVRAVASDALHYEVSPRHRRDGAERDSSSEQRGLGEIDEVLGERAAKLLADHERDGALAMAQELLKIETARAFASDAAKTAAQAEAAADHSQAGRPPGTDNQAADSHVDAEDAA